MKESRKPAIKQDIRSVKKTPETFIKQMGISGKGSTSHSKNFNTVNQVPVSIKGVKR